MKRTFAAAHIAVLLAVAVALLAGYLFASSPDGVAVSAEGTVQGYINVARSKLQGERFWREQLQAARNALAWEVSAPERRARREARTEEMDQRTRELREDLYQRNPRARPSPAEEKAEVLREEADRVEHADLVEQLERYRLKRVEELQRTVAFLEARSEQPGAKRQ